MFVTTHKNPLSTYKEIFNGTGLDWLFPWVHGADRFSAALNLQQTLILTTTLVLTGLAVAFAFRCGLFNIGGQGQYIIGSIVAVWVASSWTNSTSSTTAGSRPSAASRSRFTRARSSPSPVSTGMASRSSSRH